MKIKDLLLPVLASALTIAAATSCFPEDGKDDLNPEVPGAGSGENPGDGGNTGNAASGLVSRIHIRECMPSESSTTLTFEYDNTGNISKITELHDDSGNGVDYTVEYIFDWNATRVDIFNDNGAETPAMTIHDDNGDGVAERVSINRNSDTREYITLEYDSSWHLLRTGSDDPYIDREFSWTDGNLKGSSGDEDCSYKYSGYENTVNIDLNWLLTGGYGIDMFMIPGLTGLFGIRSQNYAGYVPLFDLGSPGAAREPIPEDGEYTYTSSSQDIDRDKTDTIFNITDGRLTGITGKVPVYTVYTEYTVYRTITNYDNYTENGGERLYSDYTEKVLSSIETNREPAYDYIIEYSISYYRETE